MATLGAIVIGAITLTRSEEPRPEGLLPTEALRERRTEGWEYGPPHAD
jgi:hypothetical protein